MINKTVPVGSKYTKTIELSLKEKNENWIRLYKRKKCIIPV